MNDRSMAVLFSYAVRAWKATTPELNGHPGQSRDARWGYRKLGRDVIFQIERVEQALLSSR